MLLYPTKYNFVKVIFPFKYLTIYLYYGSYAYRLWEAFSPGTYTISLFKNCAHIYIMSQFNILFQ